VNTGKKELAAESERLVARVDADTLQLSWERTNTTSHNILPKILNQILEIIDASEVNTGKKELAAESERLVARVDDLQDLVEDLRKDVVTRARPASPS
jgi:hypothetical protein